MTNINTQDLFNFRDYVLFLKDKLDNTKNSEVVGVHGDYGAGKTTTMNILKQLYQEDGGIDNILEFSAWRNYYNKEDTVWKALLYELAGKIYDIFDRGDIIINSEYFKGEITDKEKLKSLFKDILGDKKIDKLSKKDLAKDYIKNICLEIQYNLYQDIKDFNGKLSYGDSEFSNNKIGSTIKIGLLGIDLLYDKFLNYNNLLGSIISSFAPKESKNEGFLKSGETIFNLLKKEEQELKKVKIDSLEVIQRKFDILLSFYNLISGIKPLIIMIDDLDRILPEKSVEIIEILRIFFEKSQRIHFICAIDIRVIEKGIERKFNQLNQGGDLSRIEFEEYLEKIITIPFDLPAIPLVDFDVENNIFGVDKLIEEKFKELDKTSYENNDNKELKVEEGKLILEVKKDYSDYFKNIKYNQRFYNVIKTGLQANPRKIKRFIDVFEIYFKILLYRGKKYDSNLIYKEDDCIFLAKMLIIKLEWDEIYKEFVKDKFFIGFLEQIARLDSGNSNESNDDFVISYNLTKFIKASKKFKIQSLYGMLSIEKFFWDNNKINGELNDMKKGVNKYLLNIYKIYYFNVQANNSIDFSNNENLDNIYKYNLIKYLYEKDEVRANNYIKIFTLLSKDQNDKNSRIENTRKIINFYKGYTEELKKEKEELDIKNLKYNSSNYD